jgi:hypothetical protein
MLLQHRNLTAVAFRDWAAKPDWIDQGQRPARPRAALALTSGTKITTASGAVPEFAVVLKELFVRPELAPSDYLDHAVEPVAWAEPMLPQAAGGAPSLGASPPPTVHRPLSWPSRRAGTTSATLNAMGAGKAGADYPTAVVCALVDDFPDLANSLTADVVRDAVERQRRQPEPMFECIVDHPTLSNWKLVPRRDEPSRVRLICLRLHLTTDDQNREQRINQALHQIPA